MLPRERALDRLRAAVHARCRELRLEPPSPERITRLVRSAMTSYERRLSQAIHARLSVESVTALEGLLSAPRADVANAESARAPVVELKADPGPPGLASVLDEIAKLRQLRAIQLPPDLFTNVPPKVRQAYRQRVQVEEPYELRRHPEAVRSTLLAAWAADRSAELTDNLVETLVQTIERIDTTAQRPLPRARHHDLLAFGQKGVLYLLPAQELLLLGGGGHDRGRPAPLHGDER